MKNPKSQYLNPKQILIHQFSKFQTCKFGTLGFWIWDLFRISNFGFRILVVIFLCLVSVVNSFAQDNEKLATLTKQIIEAQTNEELYPLFEELKDLYLDQNKYNEFIEFLKSLSTKKKGLGPFINYYVGTTRYQQLKYLEKIQRWDEYFNQGNNYRDELTANLKKVVSSFSCKEKLPLYARLILWQFHQDQQDAFLEEALQDLMSSVLEYAKEAKDIQPLKEVADRLFAYGEKLKSKELYRKYADKIISSDIRIEELKDTALGFYKEGNLELAEVLYDAYINKILTVSTREDLISVLGELAILFSYKDEGRCDPVYAEKIFEKLEEIGAKDSFNEELMYLRAFNLEKSKEFRRALDIYTNLIQGFPQSSHLDEAEFKIGMIYTYILRDIINGRGYFKELAKKQSISSHVISSLYQLGLLSQWEQDLEKAKEFYQQLIEKAGDNFSDTVSLAKTRLKEIEEARPIEYNLKTFLDTSLKEEYFLFDTTKLDLKAHPSKAKKEVGINVNARAYLTESGCLQIDLQYLWSGNLGNIHSFPLNEPTFNTTYTHPGTKEINLVVVSSAGIIDRNTDWVDIY